MHELVIAIQYNETGQLVVLSNQDGMDYLIFIDRDLAYSSLGTNHSFLV